MFKVGNKCTVKFWRLASRHQTACVVTRSDGVKSCGIATLHPNDRHHKIIGKKVALTKALSQSFDKYERTLIWDAFWEWVHGWGVK